MVIVVLYSFYRTFTMVIDHCCDRCVIVKISYLHNKVDAITNLQIANRDCKTEGFP